MGRPGFARKSRAVSQLRADPAKIVPKRPSMAGPSRTVEDVSDGEPIPLDLDLRAVRLQAEHERRKWDVVLHVLAAVEAARGAGPFPQPSCGSVSSGDRPSDLDVGAAPTDREGR
jgi:hypothetical protein